MALFSKGNMNSQDFHVEAATGYEGTSGAHNIMIESIQNDMSIFSALITNDFKEITEGVDESILEASGAGFVSKIIEFVKGVWAKIKGLFESFMVHVNGVLIRDNKKLVEKYKQQVLNKNYDKDNFKYKFRNCKKGNATDVPTETIKDTVVHDEYSFDELIKKNDTAIKQITEEINKTDYQDGLRGAIVQSLGGKGGKVESGDFLNEMMDAMYEDENEYEGFSSSEASSIMTTLTNSSKILTMVEKNRKTIDSAYNDRLKELDKAKRTVSSYIPNSEANKDAKAEIEGKERSMGSKAATDRYTVALNAMYESVKAHQSVDVACANNLIAISKFHIKQCRQLFIKCAAYNPKKSANENAVLMEAFASADEFDFNSLYGDNEY